MKMQTREMAAAHDELPASPQSPPPQHAAPCDLLALIDQSLTQYTGRQLVAAVEVTDLLLDLRSRIALEAAFGAALDTAVDERT
jgi:hypothetical protein